jgi:hypothetical protein
VAHWSSLREGYMTHELEAASRRERERMIGMCSRAARREAVGRRK